MKKVGLIVNPVAGIGGRVGLKGSDGTEILAKAIALGAKPEAATRAQETLKVLRGMDVEILTFAGEMGEDECVAVGLKHKVVGKAEKERSDADDTIRAAKIMKEEADLLLFAGGDGTARNVYSELGEAIPVIGIPAGVKIHSGVFAVTPKCAGKVAKMYLERQLLNIKLAEVMDIDEDAFRSGVVTAKLYGYMRVPEESRYVQSVKSGGAFAEQEAIQGVAMMLAERMREDDAYYLIGPGTTTRTVMEELGLKNTLLGVDIIKNKKVVINDAAEQEIINIVGDSPLRIIVTIIGGQGHLFGRGNQQISPRIIRAVGKDNIFVVSSVNKLTALNGRPLLVDTGDEDLNEMLSGYIKVLTGFSEFTMCKIGY